MCGIAGYIGKKKLLPEVSDATLHLMLNRGPDAKGFREYNRPEFNLYFLHSRLSIIDLDERSSQPFEIGDCSLIFNGEIYNYVEIKKELEKKGHRFHTESDTEVLLRSYIEYGERCVERFNGMWSFAIYDKAQGTLILSRDRFAEKPLYYLEENDGIYFGSEIKFIQKLANRKLNLNYNHLSRYLVNGYKSLYKTDDTFFKEVKELKYADNAIIDKGLKLTTYKYWKPDFKVNSKMTLSEAVEGTRHHLMESVKIRLRSDVPLAFCLSGGVDSAGLVSIASKCFNYDVATFSIIDSDERYNELDNIKATIDDLKCRHTLIELNYENTLEKLKDLVAYHDAPVATITYFVHSLLSEAIAKHGYKVSISGTAADELFTGYYDHFILHLYEMRNHPDYAKYRSDWETHIGNFVRNPFLKNPDLYTVNKETRDHIYLDNEVFSSYMKNGFKEEFFEEQFTEKLLHNRMLNELFHEATPLILHEDDLNSMKYSIENRSPFLDPDLFQFAYSIPEEFLILNGYGKYILREALKGILNDKVRLDRRKKGFNASIASIVNFKSKATRDFLLEPSKVFDILDRDKIASLFNLNHYSDTINKFVFNFINVKLFVDQHH